jgi:hypothetical protein
MAASTIARDLHLEDLGVGDARRQPRWPSIGLASCSCGDALLDLAAGTPSAWPARLALGVVGQELVQRRVEQADGHRQALHRLKMPMKSSRW